MISRMKFVKDSKLYVDEEAKLLGEGAQRSIAICDCLEKVVDADSRICWFRCTGIHTVMVDIPTTFIFSNFLVASQGNC